MKTPSFDLDVSVPDGVIEKTFGRGWAFPPEFAPEYGVAMVSGADDVRQSLQILFSTLPGERVMREAFGCDLNQFMFANISAALVAGIRSQIEDCILAYEPRAEILALEVVQAADAASRLYIQLTYRLAGMETSFNLDGAIDLLSGWSAIS